MSLSTENSISLEEVVNNEERKKWLDAMKSKINSLSECKTFLVDETPDIHEISCKWVFNVKRH